MNDTPVTTAVEHQEISAQNQEAAKSSIPLGAAAVTQSGEGSEAHPGASAAEGFATQGTSNLGNGAAASNGAVGATSPAASAQDVDGAHNSNEGE